MNYYIEKYDDNFWGTFDPELRYENYIPSDFLVAPGPNMEYTYYVTDPHFNEFLYDYKYNLEPDALRARSVFIDGEYKWIYEAHWDKAIYWPGMENNEYLPLIDTWSTPYTQVLYPQTEVGEWDFEIIQAKRDLISGRIDLELKIESNYPSYGNWYNEETGITEISYKPNPYLKNTQLIDVYLNNNNDPIYECDMLKQRPDEYLFYKLEGEHWYDKEEVYVPEWNEPTYMKVSIPPELAYDTLQLNVSSHEQHQEYISPSEHNEEIKVNMRPDTSENFSIPLDQQSYFDINFLNSDTYTVSIPYEFKNGVVTKKEEFKFRKLYNEYKYPTTTTDLFSLEYSKGNGPELPSYFEREYNAKININGVNANEIKIKTRVEGKKIIFSIDEKMYYDTDKKIVEKGINNQGYKNEIGLVLPWDYSSNGEINFEIELQTYKPYTFNMELFIGSDKPLRGEGGEYQFVEVNNEE